MSEANQEQQAEEVEGYDVTSGGLWPAGTPHPAPISPYDPSQPANGGWDGVGLRYVPPVHVVPVTSVGGKRRRPF